MDPDATVINTINVLSADRNDIHQHLRGSSGSKLLPTQGISASTFGVVFGIIYVIDEVQRHYTLSLFGLFGFQV